MLQSRATRAAAAAALTTAAALAACGDSGSDAVGPRGSGRLVVQLTDAPFPYDSIRGVDVFVVRVDAKQADADSADAAARTEDDDRGGWVTLAEPKAKFDLLTLRDGKFAVLGEKALPAGSYRAFRLVLDASQSSVTLKNGAAVDVQWPSAGRSGLKIQLAKAVDVKADSTATMLVDFDVEGSFVMRGNAMRNGLLFKPVLRAATR
ncbi:DUF4382 domain-containing protein [Roseisolibacter sp. H3M3-2]|uniref:DUF4382 domain-containing protein n=1 Tax=Roseisolibacter sp. H3M3-2 TaxID=3031323 RepID=UPI0023D9CF29|nr:DUF4382 domain-containing protein [Roseisolibacter sp. H3M3-2]MDF1505781.1 DUF4382 domain-containing protein [Roseisolibacter sp. H3M3-2]